MRSVVVHSVKRAGKLKPTDLDKILDNSICYEFPQNITTFGLLASYLEEQLELRLPEFQVLSEVVSGEIKRLAWSDFNAEDDLPNDNPIEAVDLIDSEVHHSLPDETLRATNVFAVFANRKDSIYDVVEAVATPAKPLPRECELHKFIAQAPAYRFPVPQELFFRLPDLNRDKLFRPANAGEKCFRIIPFVQNLIEPPVAGGSKNNFHHFWDSLLSDVMQFFCTAGSWDKVRNTGDEGSTGILRPHLFVRFASRYALLRAEEKGDTEKANYPQIEITRKLDWTYGSAIPYILGYHATGYWVTFCTLSCDVNMIEKKKDIVSFNLQLPEGRLNSFIACLNISRILPTLKDLCLSNNAPPDFIEYDRSTGKRVEIHQSKVLKIYAHANWYFRVKNVYTELQKHQHQVRSVEQLLHSNDKELSLVFERGYSSMPRTLNDLRACLQDMCEALVWLHSRGLMHRDIRWDNVVRSTADQTSVVGGHWLLLDFDEARQSPCEVAHSLKPRTHAPEMLTGAHNTSVDIWGLGHLLFTCALELDQDLKEIMGRCLSLRPEERPTAADLNFFP